MSKTQIIKILQTLCDITTHQWLVPTLHMLFHAEQHDDQATAQKTFGQFLTRLIDAKADQPPQPLCGPEHWPKWLECLESLKAHYGTVKVAI